MLLVSASAAPAAFHGVEQDVLHGALRFAALDDALDWLAEDTDDEATVSEDEGDRDDSSDASDDD